MGTQITPRHDENGHYTAFIKGQEHCMTEQYLMDPCGDDYRNALYREGWNVEAEDAIDAVVALMAQTARERKEAQQ